MVAELDSRTLFIGTKIISYSLFTVNTKNFDRKIKNFVAIEKKEQMCYNRGKHTFVLLLFARCNVI